MSKYGRRSQPPNVVFFDLETTGFDRPIRPVQIGAIDSWGQRTYNQFVWPRSQILPLSAQVYPASASISSLEQCNLFPQVSTDSEFVYISGAGLAAKLTS